MSAASAPRQDQWDRWLPLALFAAALVLRLYRLAANPLWLDELFGWQLGRLGPLAILENSWYETIPPLYHLLVWLGSGFATARSEWAYRWIAVFTGAATIPLVYSLARRWAGRWAAAGAALALLLSPAHLYYSQEERSYGAAAFVAALSAWVLLAGSPRLTLRRLWAWALVTVAGLLLNYSYLMIAGVQTLFVLGLGWPAQARVGRSRAVWGALALVAAVAVVVVRLAVHTMTPAIGVVTGPLMTLWTTLQALTAGDLARYGLHPDHTWLAGLLALIALLGVWRLARRPAGGWELYVPAQLLLPLAAYFLVLRPLAHIEMQLYQTRQFLVLLPVAYVAAAVGVEQIHAGLARLAAPRWLAAGLGGALLVALVGLSAPGLGRYWTVTKSPEGEVARFMRDHGVAGAVVISLHPSIDAALDFYAPDANRYFTKQRRTPDGIIFGDTLSVQVKDWPTFVRPYTLTDISPYPRRWIAWQTGVSDELVVTLTAGCTPIGGAQTISGPFAVTLVDNCPPLE